MAHKAVHAGLQTMGLGQRFLGSNHIEVPETAEVAISPFPF
jgi:hypothetical protein